jgi:hypothetical protein
MLSSVFQINDSDQAASLDVQAVLPGDAAVLRQLPQLPPGYRQQIISPHSTGCDG